MNKILVKLVIDERIEEKELACRNVYCNLSSFKGKYGRNYVRSFDYDKSGVILEISFSRYFNKDELFRIEKHEQAMEVQKTFLKQFKECGYDKVFYGFKILYVDLFFDIPLFKNYTFNQYANTFNLIEKVYQKNMDTEVIAKSVNLSRNDSMTEFIMSDKHVLFIDDWGDFCGMYWPPYELNDFSIGKFYQYYGYDIKLHFYNLKLYMQFKYKRGKNAELNFNDILEKYPYLNNTFRLSICKKCADDKIYNFEMLNIFNIYESFLYKYKRYLLDKVFDDVSLKAVLDENKKCIIDKLNSYKGRHCIFIWDNINDLYDYKTVREALVETTKTKKNLEYKIGIYREKFAEIEKDRNCTIFDTQKIFLDIRNYIEDLY